MNLAPDSPMDAFELDMSMAGDATTPIYTGGNAASARFAGKVVDENSWTGAETIELYGSVDGTDWVPLGVTINGTSAATRTSSLVDIRGYRWLKAVVASNGLTATKVAVYINPCPFPVDQVVTVPTLASPPTDGTLVYIDEATGELVRYDPVRQHWLGEPKSLVGGNASTANPMHSRFGGTVGGASRGVLIAYPSVVCEASIYNSASITANLELYLDNSSAGTLCSIAAALYGSSDTVDIDIAANQYLSHLINASVGTPSNTITLTIHRRKFDP